jgi:hypothetical protein
MMRKASKFTPVGKSRQLNISGAYVNTKTVGYLAIEYGTSYTLVPPINILLYKPSGI